MHILHQCKQQDRRLLLINYLCLCHVDKPGVGVLVEHDANTSYEIAECGSKHFKNVKMQWIQDGFLEYASVRSKCS